MGHSVTPELTLPPGRMPAELLDIHWQIVHEESVTILDLLDALPWFRSGADWKPWRSFLAAVYGLPMDEEELAIYRRCTGRNLAPEFKAKEVWMAVGRRGRKSAIAALIGVYEGAYRDHRPHKAPGERAVIPIIAKDKEDAKTIKGYVGAILGGEPQPPLLEGDVLAERIRLRTEVDILIRAYSPTAGRSKSIPCSLNDEIAFWPTQDAATPDEEVLRGVRPGMANIPGALLVGMSSPYAKKGLLYDAHEAHYGMEDDPVLFWKAPTLTMQQTDAVRIFVAEEWAKDPVSAKAEFGWDEEVQGPAPEGGHAGIFFREDVEIFVDPEVLKAITAYGIKSIPPCSGEPVVPLAPGQERDPKDQRFTYFAFFDASGGSSDSAALSIAHYDHVKGRAIQDFVREWPAPFQPKTVAKEAAADLERYRLKTVVGDAYAGEWVPDRFADFGIGFTRHPLTKREIYGGILPNLNNREVELLDDPRVFRQLKSLERRRTATGLEIIDHPPNGRDDVANVTAGALYDAWRHGRFMTAREPEVMYVTTQQIQEKEIGDLLAEMEGGGPEQDLWHEKWLN